MLNRRNVIYVYDGSFYGLMTAVFEAYYSHTYPDDIQSSDNMQMRLAYDYMQISADEKKAERVIDSILKKISPNALYRIYCVYLSPLYDKEMCILDFMIDGYKYGASIVNRLNLESASKLINTAKNISSEAHQYLGFVRFRKLKNGIYYSEIEPKGRILSLISQHFCKRFSSMPFLINDLNHNECLAYNGKTWEIRYVDSRPMLEYAEDEEKFSDMWREFYNTIEIKERHNEKCRMSHMPKRYWRCMTEFN